MGFCTFCGKQLADGEVCNCEQSRQAQAQQAAQTQQAQGYNYGQPQGSPYAQQAQGAPYGQPGQQAQKSKAAADIEGGVKDAVNYAKEYVKDPFKSTEEFYKKKSLSASAVLVAVSAVACVLATLLNLISMIIYKIAYARSLYRATGAHLLVSFNKALKAAGMTKWDILHEADGVYPALHGWNFIQAIFFPLIYIVLMTAAAIGISLLIQNVIMKEKTDLNKAAALAGSVSLPVIGMLVISIVSHFIHVAALNDLIFPILIKCLGVLAIIQGSICLGHEIKDNKKLVISIAMFVAAFMIVNYLVNLLILSHCPACFTLM